MRNQELVIADDDDSGLQKLKSGPSENQGTAYDYAQVLKEMQKELEKIPTKYPEEGESYQESTERAAASNENLELNLVKTTEPKDINEDTENIAYSESAKKDTSEADEAYDEDFDNSEEKPESKRSEKDKVDIKNTNQKGGNNGNLDNKGTVKRQEIAKPPATDEEDNEEKYSSEGFEEEEVDEVPDLPEKKATIEPKKTIAEPKKQENIKKGAPTALAATVKPKEAQKNAKPPQLAQTAPAKNFKVRNMPNNKEAKKDIPKPPKEVKKDVTVPQNEVKKPLNPVKPPLKRPASATAKIQTKKEKPKPKEEEKAEINEDLNFEIEEHVHADQATNNPASERVIVPASKGLLASLKIERPKSQTNPRKQGDKLEDMSLAKTQQPTTGVRIRTVKKEPKDMLRQIFEDFKKKEEKIKEKDEKIFAVEETDKRIKSLTSVSNQNKEQEVNWVGNGMGLTSDVAGAVKKKKEERPKKESGGALDFAKGFLASLESKFKKVPKLGQDHEVKDENNEKKGKTKEGKKEEKLEKTWKYETGQGVDSEYLKTQKLKEKEYKSRFTELFKSEKVKNEKQKHENLQRVKEIMNKEKENQKNIQQAFVKDFRAKTKNAEKKEEREPKVLQVQNIYLEEEARLKKEQQKEEIHQLKLKLKLLKQQNEGLKKDLTEIKRQDSDASRALDSLAAKKAVILLGKMDFTSLSSIPKVKDSSTTGSSQRRRPSYSETILSEGRDPHNLDKLTPIEIIINKFADQGLSLEQVYQLLDENEDNLLTTKEIKDGLKKLELELDSKDINYIVSVLDKNTDGTITLPEFTATLQESLNVRKEYKDIMGDLSKVNNPIVLEERMLDIATKKKLIEEDAKKVSSEMKVQEYEYKQLLKKLQEFEHLAGPKDDKKVNLDTYRDNILSLKIEIQDIEDLKARTVMMQEERMKDIAENIEALESKIEKAIRQIHNEKRKAKEKGIIQQKEEIRKLFMEKAFGELEREIEEIDTGIDKNVEKVLAERQKIEGRIEEEGNQNALEYQIQNGAAIRVQKVYRGMVERKRVASLAKMIIGAKSVIVKRFRSFKKRTKLVTMLTVIKKTMRGPLSFGFTQIKQHSENIKKEEEEQKAQEERKREEMDRENQDSAENSRVSSQANNSIVKGLSKLKISLYTILYLQNVARRCRGWKAPELENLYIQKGRKIKYCQVCKQNPIERVCKTCEVAAFCMKCFATTHRSRKNHPFIEIRAHVDHNSLLDKITEENEDTAEELKYLKQKYEAEFDGLLLHMRDWDINECGYFDAKELRETLKRKVKEEDDLSFIIKLAKTYCNIGVDDIKIDYTLLTGLLNS